MNLKITLNVLIADSDIAVVLNALVRPWAVACICCFMCEQWCEIIGNTGSVLDILRIFM